MKLIIAGSRTVTDGGEVARAVADALGVFGVPCAAVRLVVVGGAAGADRLGAQWARDHGIPVETFPANWKAHGKAAGPVRNRAMAGYADALVAVWDGRSKGTADMVNEMRKRQKPVYVHLVGVGGASRDG